jgi:protein SCO1/2
VLLSVPALALAALNLALAGPAGAEPMEDHSHHHHNHQAAAEPGYRLTEHRLVLPETRLIRDDGKQVDLVAELDDGRPVVLNFIYTTCTAICPMLSHTFAQFQAQLGPEADTVRMVSVSIDPEHDTPARLAAYARKFQAGPQWAHYTGTVDASVRVQKAFGAYYGDKMNHRPVVFMRAAPGKPWIRLDGFTNADDLVREYRALLHKSN